MRSSILIAAAALSLLAGTAGAATIEVKMLNKGEAGAMVFEPAFVSAKSGDVIHFASVDPGHNVESIKGMLPEGAEPFKSEPSEDFDLTVGAPGLYGIKCTPHYAMGMVALIEVESAGNRAEAEAVEQKGKAKARFADLFAQVK